MSQTEGTDKAAQLDSSHLVAEVKVGHTPLPHTIVRRLTSAFLASNCITVDHVIAVTSASQSATITSLRIGCLSRQFEQSQCEPRQARVHVPRRGSLTKRNARQSTCACAHLFLPQCDVIVYLTNKGEYVLDITVLWSGNNSGLSQSFALLFDRRWQ